MYINWVILTKEKFHSFKHSEQVFYELLIKGIFFKNGSHF